MRLSELCFEQLCGVSGCNLTWVYFQLDSFPLISGLCMPSQPAQPKPSLRSSPAEMIYTCELNIVPLPPVAPCGSRTQASFGWMMGKGRYRGEGPRVGMLLSFFFFSWRPIALHCGGGLCQTSMWLSHNYIYIYIYIYIHVCMYVYPFTLKPPSPTSPSL